MSHINIIAKGNALTIQVDQWWSSLQVNGKEITQFPGEVTVETQAKFSGKFQGTAPLDPICPMILHDDGDPGRRWVAEVSFKQEPGGVLCTINGTVTAYATSSNALAFSAGKLTGILAHDLTPAERSLVSRFDSDPLWTRERLLESLMEHLELAMEVELATIPIYLYAYYSIDRTKHAKPSGSFTNYSPLELFANEAGGLIMSVAVEEMLHLSLASNILYAIGGEPSIYQKSPSSYPTNLPHHAAKGPDGKPLQIPLSKLSFEQLWRFLEIEYPEAVDANPGADDWKTIGQLYSYIRCLICSSKLTDEDFRARLVDQQIAPGNYSPNNIDTVYPHENFNKLYPPRSCPKGMPGSAASATMFPSNEDSHAGRAALLRVSSKQDALDAIATICDQGEGYDHSRWDDSSQFELSHYSKFMSIMSHLDGYPDKLPKSTPERIDAVLPQYREAQLKDVVFDFPDNPTTADYPETLQNILRFCNGLYQYMLIMVETVFRVPSDEQRLYFNRALHLSMIWMLDKLIQEMRKMTISGGRFDGKRLAPTFENFPLGPRANAYQLLVELGERIKDDPNVGWIYTTYIARGGSGIKLPDVSKYWS